MPCNIINWELAVERTAIIYVTGRDHQVIGIVKIRISKLCRNVASAWTTPMTLPHDRITPRVPEAFNSSHHRLRCFSFHFPRSTATCRTLID